MRSSDDGFRPTSLLFARLGDTENADQLPPPGLAGCYRFGEGIFAGTPTSDEDAPIPAVRCGKPARGQIDPGAPFGNTAGLDFRIVIARLAPVSDLAYEGQNDSSRRVYGGKGKDTSGYP